jgi:hypothetical protein
MFKYGFIFTGTEHYGRSILDTRTVTHSVKVESDLKMDSAAMQALAELSAKTPKIKWSEVVSMTEIGEDGFTWSQWGNCLYGGNAIGHSTGVCTADSCY